MQVGRGRRRAASARLSERPLLDSLLRPVQAIRTPASEQVHPATPLVAAPAGANDVAPKVVTE